VPTHAIASRYLFGSLSRLDILKALIVNGGVRIPYVGNLITFLRIYALTLGTNCVDGPIDNCMKEIFNNEDNDIVVPVSSQKGGLPPAAVTFFGDDVAHSDKKLAKFGFTIVDAKGVLNFDNVHQKVISLLRENPDAGSSSFTRAGYNPPALQYTFLPGVSGNPDGRNVTATLSINPALAGSTYKYGDTVLVTVTGSSEIQTLLATYAGKSMADVASDVEPNKSFTFPYPVPREATGRVDIKVFGFDGTGMIAADSSYINIGIPVTATLDSIRVIGREKTFVVPKNDSIQLRVKAYYSDTVREVTYMPGFTFAFFENNVAPSLFGIKGVNTGFDRVILTYQGKLDTIYVQVPLSIGPGGVIPVRWVSFKGNRTSAGNQLTWTTATEENNSHYEVEHSSNGSSYAKLATVNSSGNSNSLQTYQYLHGISTPGNHYYRIKQVDRDGNFTYTGVVLIKILEKNSNSITIYPNPAKNTVFIGFENTPALPYTIQMVSPLGQVLLTKTITQASNQEDLDISKLPKGLYYLHIADDKQRMLFNNKIVVQ
jgi:hypothetical protein